MFACFKIVIRTYIDSPDWIKNKKATINPINKKYNKCFHYSIIVALNLEEIGKNPECLTKIKPYPSQHLHGQN